LTYLSPLQAVDADLDRAYQRGHAFFLWPLAQILHYVVVLDPDSFQPDDRIFNCDLIAHAISPGWNSARLHCTAVRGHESAARFLEFTRTALDALAAAGASVLRIESDFDPAPRDAHAPKDRAECLIVSENAAIGEKRELGSLQVVRDTAPRVLPVVA
jgi:hypothetical protein